MARGSALMTDDQYARAREIKLFSFSTPPMRAFHTSWIAFFLCFMAWFGIAPLMALVRSDLKLTPAEVGNTIIASVAGTVFARLLAGWLCDRLGPRRTYSALLIVGALPVMGIGLAHTYKEFLLFRLVIGAIGASFVVSQYHTSIMFAPRVAGTANAITAGWGNLGGGIAQIVMPLIAGGLLAVGVKTHLAWRLAMIVPAVAMMLAGFAYYAFTQDSTEADFPPRRKTRKGTFLEAALDYRVWILFVLYGACFGIEITLDNTAALYFKDSFHLSLGVAGLLASLAGAMNLFARAGGGALGDGAGARWELKGKSALLGILLLMEGTMLMVFSRLTSTPAAAAVYLTLGLFVCMACGATFAITPFVNESAVGSVSGIVGAGGNASAVLAGFLFKSPSLSGREAYLILGLIVACCSLLTLPLGAHGGARAVVAEEETEVEAVG
jgi:MFS transporter, NNP family, nitrate/nitrite transporter